MKKGSSFSIEEILSLENFGEMLINNDGSFMVYEIISTDWKKDAYLKDLWLYDVKNHTHTQIASKLDNYLGMPKWSHDGKLLSMTCKDENKNKQIYVLDIRTKEKYQISTHEKGIEKYVWAGDNKGFYYTATSPSAKDKEKRDKQFGKFNYIDEDKVTSGLFYLDLSKALKLSKVRYQMPDDLYKKSKKDAKNVYYPSVLLNKDQNYYIHQMSVSPNNESLALAVAPSPTMEDYDDLSLCVYDIKKKRFDQVHIDDFAGSLHFSPDSQKLCISLMASWLHINKLAVYDIETKAIEDIETGIDEVVNPIKWTEKGILVHYLDKVSSKYAFVNENKLEAVLDKKDVFYYNLHMTHDGKHMIYTERSANTIAEIYVNGKKISNQSRILKGRKLSNKQMIQWHNNDGIEIEGVLSLPSDYDSAKKYPLLVIIHGGPAAISLPFALNDRMYPLESFIDQGFIILEPNYRGSAGYGDKFRSSNYRNLGVGDYEDVISGVDYLINQGYADQDKLGVMGWSQGGYISAYCATYSERFKAISVGAGISNWETYYFNTDIPKFTKLFLGDVPFKDKAIYEKTSPMTHIKKAKTPTLIQHGSADKRVPVANAYELYRSLKELKLEPKMVIYENMGHGPSTPGLRRAINRQNLYWFCHHLLGQDLDGYYLKD